MDLRRKKSIEINKILEKKNYIKVDENYNYLIKMTMDSVSEESIEQLKNKYKEKQELLTKLMNTTIQEMWLSDLEELKEILKF